MAKKVKRSRWVTIGVTLLIIWFVAFILSGLTGFFTGESTKTLSGNVALIPVKGVILGESDDSLFGGGIASSTDIVEQIEKAAKKESIHAIVLEINSPGGSAVASDEIAQALKKVNKTTVAWIREVGASGGYWVASSTDHIIANRMSITGSIGVIASYLEFSGLLERYNVTYQRMVAGKHKDLGSPYKKLTPEETELFQRALDRLRDYFVDEIAENRGMNRDYVDSLATGMFYIGSEAHTLGLVDELGGKDEVVAYVEQVENIQVDFVDYKPKKGLSELFGSVIGEQSFHVGEGIGHALTSQKPVSQLNILT